ncbi:MAG: hypothetical protein Q8909_12535 [Bacteroidota bacterium]|nr:hypothetical protein [Bacteroidota bacterium]
METFWLITEHRYYKMENDYREVGWWYFYSAILTSFRLVASLDQVIWVAIY